MIPFSHLDVEHLRLHAAIVGEVSTGFKLLILDGVRINAPHATPITSITHTQNISCSEAQEMGVACRSADPDGSAAPIEQETGVERQLLQRFEGQIAVIHQHGVATGPSRALQRHAGLQIELRDIGRHDGFIHEKSGVGVALPIAVRGHAGVELHIVTLLADEEGQAKRGREGREAVLEGLVDLHDLFAQHLLEHLIAHAIAIEHHRRGRTPGVGASVRVEEPLHHAPHVLDHFLTALLDGGLAGVASVARVDRPHDGGHRNALLAVHRMRHVRAADHHAAESRAVGERRAEPRVHTAQFHVDFERQIAHHGSVQSARMLRTVNALRGDLQHHVAHTLHFFVLGGLPSNKHKNDIRLLRHARHRLPQNALQTIQCGHDRLRLISTHREELREQLLEVATQCLALHLVQHHDEIAVLADYPSTSLLRSTSSLQSGRFSSCCRPQSFRRCPAPEA